METLTTFIIYLKMLATGLNSIMDLGSTGWVTAMFVWLMICVGLVTSITFCFCLSIMLLYLLLIGEKKWY